MKKIVFFIATLALMTLMVPAIAIAAPSDNGVMAQGSAAQSTTGIQATQSFPNFVDNNGDGICDNYPSYAGKQLSNCCICGMCSRFVDENGDGVCDNRGTMQNGCNACPAYIDENGDGVENVEFKLSDCAYVKLNDDADLFDE